MADIIGVLAHGEELLEELGNTFLKRMRGTRIGFQGIMTVLGTMLGGLSNHLRNFRCCASQRKSESAMTLIVPCSLLSRDHVVDEALNKSTIVGCEPLLNSPPELMIDEVGHINLPLTIKMGVLHKVDVVATTSSEISNLAHNNDTMKEIQGVI
jgi:hypothetical protein